MALTITAAVLVRPRRSLVSTGLISVVLGMIPIFGVLYWFGVQRGTWPLVLIVHLAIIAAAAAALLRHREVFASVTRTELLGRGMFSRLVTVPVERIAHVMFVPTYVGQAPEPVTQLLVQDAAGHCLFRMRGGFWHASDLEAIAGALPVPVTVVKEPVRLREFFQAYPGSAYWFENRTSVRVGVVAITVLLIMAATALVVAVFR